MEEVANISAMALQEARCVGRIEKFILNIGLIDMMPSSVSIGSKVAPDEM